MMTEITDCWMNFFTVQSAAMSSMHRRFCLVFTVSVSNVSTRVWSRHRSVLAKRSSVRSARHSVSYHREEYEQWRATSSWWLFKNSSITRHWTQTKSARRVTVDGQRGRNVLSALIGCVINAVQHTSRSVFESGCTTANVSHNLLWLSRYVI